MMREIKNYKSHKTMLGIEDHGLLTFVITLVSGAVSQGFGGLGLDAIDEAPQAIRKLLETVGVNKWEDLPGKYVRAKTYDDNLVIRSIGNILEDKWFDLTEWNK